MKKLTATCAIAVVFVSGCKSSTVTVEPSNRNNDPKRTVKELEKVVNKYWNASSKGKWNTAYDLNTRMFRSSVPKHEYIYIRSMCYNHFYGKDFRITDANISLSNLSLGNVTVKLNKNTYEQTYIFNYDSRRWELKPKDWELEYFQVYNQKQHVQVLKSNGDCK